MVWGLIINIYDGLIPICTMMLNIKTISIRSKQLEWKMFSWQPYIVISKKKLWNNVSEANDICSIILIFN